MAAADVVRCPECGVKLGRRSLEKLGENARCPRCDAALDTTPPPEAPDGFLDELNEMAGMEAEAAEAIDPVRVARAAKARDEREERERKQRLAKKRRAMHCVSKGLQLVLLAIVLMLVAFVVSLLAGLPTEPGSRAIMQISAIVFEVMSVVLPLAGVLLCLAVPRDSRARGFAYATVIVNVVVGFINIVVQVLLALIIFYPRPELATILAVVMYGTNLASLALPILFLWFLKRLSYYVDSRVAEQVVSELFVTGGFALAVVLFGFVFSFVPLLGYLVIALAAMGVLYLLVTIVLKFAELLRTLSDQVEKEFGVPQDGLFALLSSLGQFIKKG